MGPCFLSIIVPRYKLQHHGLHLFDLLYNCHLRDFASFNQESIGICPLTQWKEVNEEMAQLWQLA
jgi:hypothetical protein